MGHIVYILVYSQCLVVPCINRANRALGVQLGHAHCLAQARY